MSCTGDCQNCPKPCGLAKFAEDIQNNKFTEGEEKLSENILNCKSSDGEKVAVHGAWIDGTKKTVMVIGAVLVALFVGIIYANSRITRINISTAVEIEKIKTETGIRISQLEREVYSLREYAEDGRRAYEAAKKFRQRNK